MGNRRLEKRKKKGLTLSFFRREKGTFIYTKTAPSVRVPILRLGGGEGGEKKSLSPPRQKERVDFQFVTKSSPPLYQSPGGRKKDYLKGKKTLTTGLTRLQKGKEKGNSAKRREWEKGDF